MTDYRHAAKTHATSMNSGTRSLARQSVGAVVLDLVQPVGAGWDFCRPGRDAGLELALGHGSKPGEGDFRGGGTAPNRGADTQFAN